MGQNALDWCKKSNVPCSLFVARNEEQILKGSTLIMPLYICPDNLPSYQTDGVLGSEAASEENIQACNFLSTESL